MTNAVDDYDDFLDGGNHRWRRRAVGLALVVALAVAGVFVLWAMVLRDGGSAASAVQTAKVQRGSIMKTISTSATTASQSTANLSFSQSGKVTAVNVTVGQAVKQGDVLAEGDATTLQDALTRAQVNLASAQRSLNKLLESPTAADTASADQSVIQAQANLDKANTALQDLYNPTSDAQNSAQQAVLSAQSQLTKAQQARANLDATWSDSHTAAEAAVEKAQKTLDSAERAVDDASDNLSPRPGEAGGRRDRLPRLRPVLLRLDGRSDLGIGRGRTAVRDRRRHIDVHGGGRIFRPFCQYGLQDRPRDEEQRRRCRRSGRAGPPDGE